MLTLIRPCRTRYALLAVILACAPQMCAAQDSFGSRPAQPKATATQDKGVLRTYDVGDLVMNIHDHPYSDSVKRTPESLGGGRGGGGGMGVVGGGFGGGGGTGIGGREIATSGTENITMDDLLRVLTTTIAATTWSDVGGTGNVQPLGSSLVVWQSQAVHEQIEDLLKQLRAVSGERKTLTIDARWLLLNSDDLDQVILPNQNGPPKVNRTLLANLTRRPTSLRGITTCFSGQTVYLVSGTRRNVVSSYIPVVGSLDRPNGNERFAVRQNGAVMRFAADVPGFGGGNESRVGYQPVVTTHNFGALLEIRPTTVRGTDMAVVDLKSTLTVSGEPSGKTASRSLLAPSPPIVDRIAIETQELATTLRMPLGQPILVGGLTYVSPTLGSVRNSDPAAAEQRDGPAGQQNGERTENRQLYFVLELR